MYPQLLAIPKVGVELNILKELDQGLGLEYSEVERSDTGEVRCRRGQLSWCFLSHRQDEVFRSNFKNNVEQLKDYKQGNERVSLLKEELLSYLYGQQSAEVSSGERDLVKQTTS